jgi:hypothetical protein
MKKTLAFSFLFFISLTAMAQKVTVRVLSTENARYSEWQIIDDQNKSVFSGVGNLRSDSVGFSLDENRHYTFKIAVSAKGKQGEGLYTLLIEKEPILQINSDIGMGDHFFPFFTGVRAINAKITGGTTAVISDFPWQVYYISGNFRCGGSIINGNWILTAGHCTKDNQGASISPSTMFVRVGLNNPSNSTDGKTYAVNQVIVHEGYDDATLLNDIALLRLSDTINFTNAIPINLINENDVANGATVPGILSWVTGWGLIKTSPQTLPTSLQKVQLPIISNTQASTVWSSIPSTDIMAGFLNGNKDACNGDSGGPLVVPVSGENKLAGIVSWGSSSCDTYGAYTRVSDFESWIQNNTGLAIAGDSVICQGIVSSQYSIAKVPGTTAYQWVLQPAGAGVITGSGRHATVNWSLPFSGRATVILRATTTSGKVLDWFRVHVSVAPATRILSQSSDTAVCTGQPVILNVKVSGHDLIYTWKKGVQTIQTGPTSTLTYVTSKVTDSGDYTCEVTGSCGSAISKVIKLTVYPVTKITYISPASEIAFGKDLTLKVNADGHDLTYQWQKDGVAISGGNGSQLLLSSVNATDIGLYKTTVSGTCGVQTSDSIYVYVRRSNFTSDPEVFLWPSITSEEFRVALNNDSFYNIEIFSTIGKKIREQTNCQYQTRINISSLANGTYIVEVFNSKFRKSIKVIKE